MKIKNLVFAGFATLTLPAAAFAQSGPYQFYALTPCRIVDTRNTAGPTGGPALSGSATRDFPIRGNCGVPTTAKAATLNVTVVSPTADGHLRLWPSGNAMPLVSTINFVANDTAIANGAIVPLSTAPNDLSVFNFSGSAHLILDVTGYFQ